MLSANNIKHDSTTESHDYIESCAIMNQIKQTTVKYDLLIGRQTHHRRMFHQEHVMLVLHIQVAFQTNNSGRSLMMEGSHAPCTTRTFDMTVKAIKVPSLASVLRFQQLARCVIRLARSHSLCWHEAENMFDLC